MDLSIPVTFIFSLSANLAFYLTFRDFLGTTEAKRSWILTLASSCTTTLSGLYHLCLLFLHGWEDVEFLTSHTFLSQATLLYFISYLVLDLVVGSLDYRSKITLLAGWTHHTAYIAVLVYLVAQQQAIPFCLFLFEELPTASFSVGFLVSGLRSDNFFGGSYLATRLALHVYLSFVVTQMALPGWHFAVAVIPLHGFWFWQWVQQQRRLEKLQFLDWYDFSFFFLST